MSSFFWQGLVCLPAAVVGPSDSSLPGYGGARRGWCEEAGCGGTSLSQESEQRQCQFLPLNASWFWSWRLLRDQGSLSSSFAPRGSCYSVIKEGN